VHEWKSNVLGFVELNIQSRLMSPALMFELKTFWTCRYRGTYCGQDVAIKILKPERLNENLQREFQQEVSIMRWVPFPKFKHLGWESCKIVMCVLSHGD
jgi:hypothetical protein